MPKVGLSTSLGLVFLMVCASVVEARNTPCSGRKGGVVGCNGEKFICANGTLSASKRTCSRAEVNSERPDADVLNDYEKKR